MTMLCTTTTCVCAQGVTVTVNTFVDSDTGVCSPGSSTCNLRAALRANANSTATILLPSGATHALDGGYGDVGITGDIMLESVDGGAVVTIDGAGNNARFLYVGSGAKVTVGDSFTFQRFNTASAGTTKSHGTLDDNDGGVFGIEGGSVIIGEDCVFSSNVAGSAGGAAYVNAGTIVVGNGGAFYNNTAGSGGGAVYAKYSTATVGDSCIFDSNTADNGGAINARSSVLAVGNDCDFVFNTVTATAEPGGHGGAIASFDSSAATIGGGCSFTANTANGNDAYLASENDNIYCCSGTCPMGWDVVGGSPTTCTSLDGECSICGIAAPTNAPSASPTSPPSAAPCPPGYWGDHGIAPCEKCDAGYFGAIPGLDTSTCTGLCDAGTYGTNSSIRTDSACTAPCDSGYYGSADSVRINGTCSGICSRGSYSKAGAVECTTCMAGTYSNHSGATECRECSSGQQATTTNTGSTSLEDLDCISCFCSIGQICSSNSSDSCEDCAPGTYSDTIGLPECKKCGEGTFSVAAVGICTPCSAGKFADSPGTADDCKACESGRYSGAGAADCVNCTVGWFQPERGQTGCKSCLAGTFSGSGSDNCTACNPGSYSVAAAETCEACTDGFVAAESGSSYCELCNAGRHSNANRTSCETCAANTFSLGATSSCTDCTTGKVSQPGSSYCLSCDPGYVPTETAGTVICAACPAGTSAGFGAANCSACEDGYIAQANGTAFCEICGSGTTSNAERTGCLSCPNNTYSEGGVASCLNCDSGFFSDVGSTGCSPCESGTYRSLDSDGCFECPRNAYSSGGASVCSACESGKISDPGSSFCFFCDPGEVPSADGLCQECPMGTSAEYEAVNCTMCKDGYIAAEEGTAYCEICAAGTFASANRTACVECPRNTYSLGGASSCSDCIGGLSEPGSTTCAACEPGYVPSSDGLVCQACPAGTSAEFGATNCSSCENGYIAVGEATAYCEICAAGTYATANRTACVECPRNTYSLGGVSLCTGCVGGLSEPGSATCAACEPGYVPSSDVCHACPAGTSAEYESTSCAACSNGTVAASTGSASCVACEEGYVPTVNHTACELCGEGKYSLAGLAKCLVCPEGKYSVSERNECKDCEAYISGTTSGEGSTSPDDCACYVGNYLDDDSEVYICKPCSEGMVCEVEGVGLSTMALETGYWRTSPSSSEVLACPNPDACAASASNDGGCAEGYEGAYCGVCAEDYSEDATGSCLPCEQASAAGIALFAVMCALLVALIYTQQRSTATLCFSFPWLTSIVNGLKRGLRDNRVKLKIAFVNFQIMCILPSQFSVRFPSSYRTFLDYVSVVNLDALQFFAFGCWSHFYSFTFYDSLLFSTLAPIAVLLLLAALYAAKRRRIYKGRLIDGTESELDRKSLLDELRASYVGYGLLLIYVVYPSTSVKLFQTFFCDDFDDGRSMLQADLSLSCSSAAHQAMQVFSAVFILVYPVGIPLLFTWLLLRSRRQSGDTPGHSRFLWEDYGKHAYFFEVFECARRLLLTGAPLFPLDDKLSQVAVGTLICLVSMCIFVDCRPYRVRSDSDVACVAQVVLSLTFFSALLFKCDVPSIDGYDDDAFGGILILSNLVVIAAVAVSVGTTTRKRIAAELARATVIAELERALEVDRSSLADLAEFGAHKERQAMYDEQKTLELVDLRRRDQERVAQAEELRRVTTAHQLDLFEHRSAGYNCAFAMMTAGEFATLLRGKFESADENDTPKPKWWAMTMARFEGMSGFDLICQGGGLSDGERIRWIREGTADKPLDKKLTVARIKMVGMCLDSMQFGWYCKLWQSLEEGANPLMDWICVKKLGEGAFGEVFLVENRHRSAKRSAIKFVNCSGDIALIKSIFRETELQMSVHSEFVVHVESWKVVNQRFFWVLMACCSGGDLSDKLIGRARAKDVDEEQLWLWITQLCRGLVDVHAAGIIHRDLKPDNVLLDSEDNIHIADFGLAGRISAPGGTRSEFCGTPSYMAPEVRVLDPKKADGMLHGGYDARADIFALGIMIHQMCCPNGARSRVIIPDTLPEFGRGEVTQRGIDAALTTLQKSGVDYSRRIRGVLHRALVLCRGRRATAADLVIFINELDTRSAAGDATVSSMESTSEEDHLGAAGKGRRRSMLEHVQQFIHAGIFSRTDASDIAPSTRADAAVGAAPRLRKEKSMSLPDIMHPDGVILPASSNAADDAAEFTMHAMDWMQDNPLPGVTREPQRCASPQQASSTNEEPRGERRPSLTQSQSMRRAAAFKKGGKAAQSMSLPDVIRRREGRSSIAGQHRVGHFVQLVRGFFAPKTNDDAPLMNYADRTSSRQLADAIDEALEEKRSTRRSSLPHLTRQNRRRREAPAGDRGAESSSSSQTMVPRRGGGTMRKKKSVSLPDIMDPESILATKKKKKAHRPSVIL